MERKLFVRIDNESVATQHVSQMSSATNLDAVDGNEHLFRYRFETLRIDHAVLLLGKYPERFGYDLSFYLSTAQLFFTRTANDTFIVMPNGGSDFKRRFSEDMGVAAGSLFLVDTLAVRWETICQIPANQKLNKSTPDFVAFDSSSNKYVYESKGTTRPDTVDAVREKAKQQLNVHEEAGVTKFAMVAYFPNSAKLLPPYLFVSDPPTPLPQMSESIAIGLHFLKVLEFCGLEDVRIKFRDCLMLQLKIKSREDASTDTWKDNQSLNRARRLLNESLGRVGEQSGLFNDSFVGTFRAASLQGNVVKAFTGIDFRYLSQALTTIVDEEEFETFQAEDTVINTDRETIRSVFRDGTILQLDGLKEAT